MGKKIIPTILTDTIDHFEDLVKLVTGFADLVQVDFVDGYFAPEITCCEAKVLREIEIVPSIEAHLMVEDPMAQVKDWQSAGADRLVGHIEKMEDQVEFVEKVSKLGLEVGLALKLDTPLADLHSSVVSGLDVVLLMAHEIGVQGAPFNRDVLPKISELRARYPNLNIEVDGGIDAETIQDVLTAGANYFAVGSNIFASTDPEAEYQKLASLVA